MSANSQPDFSGAIERFRAIVGASGDALLPDGPVHPDRDLLALCAEAHDLLAGADAVWREARKLPHATVDNPEFAAEMGKRDALDNRRRTVLARLGKIKAATPAGVYGKAIVVSNRYCFAHQLAASLARDLITLPGLRAVLWPAGEDA